jgi:hypothetical protein
VRLRFREADFCHDQAAFQIALGVIASAKRDLLQAVRRFSVTRLTNVAVHR